MAHHSLLILPSHLLILFFLVIPAVEGYTRHPRDGTLRVAYGVLASERQSEGK
ncbi:MAG: hypothetical protein WCC99_07455 [Candidatus Sulfotelmatobacter sp.]